MPSASGKELQSAASSISDSKTTRTHFESSAHTQQSSQRLPEFVSAIKARAGKQATVNFEEALQIPASRNNATSWVASAVVSSGVDLSYVAADEPRKTSCAAGGHRVESKELEENEYPLHPLPFDVEVHQLPSGQRMVLDSHRLLVPDVAWIDWMRESEEARPRVWAVYTEPDGTSSREQWSFRTRIEWDRVAAPGSNDLELALLASHPIGDDVRPGSGSGSGSGVHFHSVRLVALHREAGIVLLRGLGENQEEVCSIVVSCPVWYFGNNPYLTCMLPPEASAVLAARSLP